MDKPGTLTNGRRDECAGRSRVLSHSTNILRGGDITSVAMTKMIIRDDAMECKDYLVRSRQKLKPVAPSR
jgi:hypothetical protein